MPSRRAFFEVAGLAGFGWSGLDALLGEAREPPALDRPGGTPSAVAQDESYWARVAAQYRTTKAVTNLEAGFFGIMAKPVLDAFRHQVERINFENSYYVRRRFDSELESAREKLATVLGASTEEIAFTRGATEALQCLIGGYNRLRPGDVVMYADTDYPSMQYAMNWLVDRRGARVARLVIPEPASRDLVLTAYAEALEANPGTRLLLLTHLNNKNGLIIPVAEIVRIAKERGADVIVDAAHSFGQVDLDLETLGADFVGLNLHKWFGAPVGCGAIYIRKERLADIDPMMADESHPPTSILSRVHTGTANFATFLTVPAALEFHDKIGPANKAARLRYLRDRWVNAVRPVAGVDVIVPDGTMVGAITSFRLGGQTETEANQRTAEELLNRFGVFTVHRTGLASGACIRATPALYNRPADADRLAAAITALAAELEKR